MKFKLNFYPFLCLFTLLLVHNLVQAQHNINTYLTELNKAPSFVGHVVQANTLAGDQYILSSSMLFGNSNVLLNKYGDDGNLKWTKQFDRYLLNDYSIDMEIDSQGDLVLLALTTDSVSQDIWLIKCDSAGTILWDTAFGGTHALNDVPSDLVLDQDSIYVAGALEDSITAKDIFLVKLNPSGNVEWEYTHDELQLNDIAAHLRFDDQYLILSAKNELIQEDGQFSVYQFDRKGNLLDEWNDTSGVNHFNDPLFLKAESDQYFLCGSKLGNSFLVCLDSLLDTNWTATFDFKGAADKALFLDVDSANNIYMAGQGKDTNANGFPVLIKYSSTGQLLWHKYFDLKHPDSTALLKAVRVWNNSLYLLGQSEQNIFVAQADTNGNIIWFKEYDSGGIDFALSLSIDSLIQVFFRSERDSGVSEWMLRLSVDSIPYDTVSDLGSGQSWVDNEVLISAHRDFVKTDYLLDDRIQYGALETFLTDSAISVIGAQSNESIAHTDSMRIRRSVPFISIGDSISYSRSGRKVRLQEYWRDFTIELPAGSNEEAFVERLDSMRPAILYGSLNYLGKWHGFANDSIYADTLQTSLRSNSTYPNAHAHVEDAWDIETGKNAIRVAVIDNGVDYRHEDFGNGTLQGSVVEDGFDFFRDRDIKNPGYMGGDHGTPSAGIIGAIRNNNIGIAGVAGGDAQVVQKGVALFDCNIEGARGFPNLEAFNRAVLSAILSSGPRAFSCDIINFSGTLSNQASLKKTMVDVARHEVLLVQSHGNDGVEHEVFPGGYHDDLAILVGSSGSDGKRAVLNQNCTGPTTTYSEYLDVLAAGCEENVRSLQQSNQYTKDAGSSVAAPLVSGVAALMQSHLYGKSEHYKFLAPEDIEALIQRNATHLSPNEFSKQTGWGRLHADSTLRMIEYPRFRVRHINPDSYASQFVFGTSVVRVYLLEDLIYGLDTLESGVYYAKQKTIRHTYSHSIPPGDTLIDAWARDGVSDGMFDDPDATTGFTYDLIPLPGSDLINYDETSATVESIGYELFRDNDSLPLAKSFEYPMPFEYMRFPYSLYVKNATFHDSLHSGMTHTAPEFFLKVYPNPTKDKLNIRVKSNSEDVYVEVKDIQGRSLQGSVKMTKAEKHTWKHELDLSAQVSGIYFISIKSDEAVRTRKVILNK